MSCKIIIPYFQEPLFEWTLANLHKAAPDAEIVPMLDDPRKGLGVRRDEGIRNSKHDHVIMVDAHMDFENNFHHKMMEAVKENPKRLVCCRCPGLDHEKLEPLTCERYGATIQETAEKSYSVDPKVFFSRWNREPVPNPINSILGGCYCLDRDWYIDGLGAPWQYHEGWGKSEQFITLANYYMGGECWLADTWAAHYFSKEGKEKNLGWFKRNIMFILYAFVPEADRNRIMDTFAPGRRTPDYGITQPKIQSDIKKMKLFLADHAVRNYAEIKAKHLT